MEDLPLEMIVEILERVDDWKTFGVCRLVSKTFKTAADLAMQSEASAAIKRLPELQKVHSSKTE